MHKRYSLQGLTVWLFTAMICIIFGVVYSITSYYNNLLKQQYYQQAKDSISQYTNQRVVELNTLENYLLQYGSTDSYVQLLNRTTEENELYHAKMCVYNTFQSNITLFADVEGLFLYSTNSRNFTCCSTAFYSNSCYDALRELLESWETMQSEGKKELLSKWRLLTTDKGSYLVRMILCPNGIIGAWLKTETLSKGFGSVFSGDNFVCLLNQEDQVIGKAPFEDFVWKADSANEYEVYQDKTENISYLGVGRPFISPDCKIISLTPLYIIDQRLTPVYGRLAVILIVMLLGLAIVALGLRHFVGLPIQSLNRLLENIQYHEDAVIEDQPNDPEERIQLNKVLNKMIAEIKGLRIRVYEEKLAQSQLEIQLLKSQISPHFLINCLSAFTSLACAREVDKDLIHRFAYVLSQHIRYTFSTKRTSSLKKEFLHIDNYLELVSFRYPESLAYRLKLPRECQKASVTPMMILTLCENSIKHALVLGKLLQIRVEAELLESPKGKQIHIVHIDSGDGYPQEILEWNNHILEHELEFQSGEHIGMYNICRSLKLNFGELADFRFSNEPGLGARTDIWLPYEEAEE